MINSYPLITLGSPYGVGYEIFLLSVADKFFNGHTPFCVGSDFVMKLFIKELGVFPVYKSIKKDELSDYKSSSCYDFILINVDDKEYGVSDIFSISKEIDGEIAYKTVKESAYLVKDSKFKSVTTLPVSKDNINLFDKEFYGHTEFYQRIWEQKEVFMTFVSEKLNVLLLTTHIPLKDVAKSVDKNLLRRGIEVSLTLKKRLGLDGKICLLGLNPHAGENGILGDEEVFYKEVVKEFNEEEIEGPIPSDTAFIKTNLSRYSIFIASYHDQGLIPFKMGAFEDGVNLSFGMKYIRTSVDHGTGVNLIGKKIVNKKSFFNAYLLARKLSD